MGASNARESFLACLSLSPTHFRAEGEKPAFQLDLRSIHPVGNSTGLQKEVDCRQCCQLAYLVAAKMANPANDEHACF